MLKLIRLEERIVLDGAMLDTVAETGAVEIFADAVEAIGEAFQQVAPPAGEVQRTQESLDIILISSDLPDIQQLVAAAQPGAYVHVFDVQSSSADVLNNVSQFADQQNLPIGNLAIVTHGDAGQINFGSTVVDSAQLSNDSQSWQQLGQQMTANATLQVYGCEVAANEAGHQLVQNLAALTGADVQASDDITGAEGDWQLEVQSAANDVNQLLADNTQYSASLDNPTIDTNTGATVNEDGFVTITNQMLSSSDPDPFDTPDQISYSIEVAPQFGRVEVNGSLVQVGQTFTQQDIDDGLVRYVHDGGENTADSFDFRVSDPGAGANQEEGTFNITIEPINDAPTLDLDLDAANRGYNGSFDESGGPVPIADIQAGEVVIGDVDSDMISQVTITLTNVFDGDNEFLVANNLPNGIDADITMAMDGNGNVTSITLTISGNATIAQYESIIQNVTYENTSNSESTPTRIINVVVTDAEGADSLVSRTTLFSQNSAPVITAPADFAIDEDNPTDVVFSVNDPDARDDDIRAELTLQNNDPNADLGTIAFNGQIPAGVTVIDGDGTDGTLIIEGSQEDINSVLATLEYTPPENFNGSASITLFVDDLGSNGDTPNDANITPGDPEDSLTDTATVNITINAVNDPPVLTTPDPDDFNEVDEDTSVKIPGLSLSDVDADPGELSVTLAVNFGTITLADTAGITFQAGTSNGDATVTFTGTQAALNNALASVCYQGNLNANDVNNGVQETLTFTVDDQGNTGAPGDDLTVTETVQFNVNPINDAPTVAAPADQTINEDNSLDFSAANGTAITVADVDANEDPDANDRDVQITLGVANGALTLGSTAGLVLVDGEGTDGTLVFQGTLAEVNAALDTLTYTPDENFNGQDTLDIRIDDLGNFGDSPDPNVANGTPGEAEDNLFATESVDITVNAVNDAPDLDLDPGDDDGNTPGTGFDNVFREDDGPIPIAAPDVSLEDVDGDPIVGLTVTIDAVPDAPAEILAVDPNTLPQGVTAIYDDANGVLTITGNASAAEYEAILAGITYENTDQDPEAGDRVLTVEVDDGIETTTAESTITVVPVNDAPDITPPNNTAIQEETRTTLQGVQISDVDARDEDVTVTLTVDSGTLIVPDDNGGVDVTGNNTDTVTLVGSQADINTQLAALDFQPAANFTGIVDFQLTVNDGGNNGEGGPLTDTENVTLTVGEVNDPPVATVPGDQTVDEDTPLVITGVSVADVDANGEDVVVTLSVNNGTISIDNNPNVVINGNGGDTITLTGTIDDINSIIDEITYQGDLNFNGDDTLTVNINDQGNTGDGGPQQDTETVDITVNPIDDEPVVDPNGPGNNGPYENTFTENGNPVSAVDPAAITIEDVDGDDLIQAEISIDVVRDAGQEFLAVDQAALNNAGLTAVYDPTNGTLTITGQASPADYEAVLATLTYENTSENPDDTPRNLSLVVTDENNTDSGAGQSIINVVPVNDPPEVTVPGQIIATEEIEQAVPGVSVSDIDAGDADIRVTVSADNGALSVPATAGVTIVGDDTGNLVLTGSVDDINAALDQLTYTGNQDFSGADTITVTANDLGNTGGGALTDSETIPVTVNDVNDPPVVTTNDGAIYPNGGTIVIGPDGLTATDPDNPPEEIIFTITDFPEHGQILVNGQPLVPGQTVTFTQADINNGAVTYVSNGDEATMDDFTFTVTDGEFTTAPQTFALSEGGGIPDPVDYFDPADPGVPIAPGNGPIDPGAPAPDPFPYSPGPLEPLFPDTDLFASAVNSLDSIGAEIETGLLNGEFTDMTIGATLTGTSGAFGNNGAFAGSGGDEIRYACSLLTVLDQGCRFNDSFAEYESHLRSANGDDVGSALGAIDKGPVSEGAMAAIGLTQELFKNCGNANQAPGNYADSYQRGVVGGEGSCAIDDNAAIAPTDASSVVVLPANVAPEYVRVEYLPAESVGTVGVSETFEGEAFPVVSSVDGELPISEIDIPEEGAFVEIGFQLNSDS